MFNGCPSIAYLMEAVTYNICKRFLPHFISYATGNTVGSLYDSPRASAFACSPVESTGPLLKYLYSTMIIIPLQMFRYYIHTWVVCITSGFIIDENFICRFFYDSPNCQIKVLANFSAIRYFFSKASTKE